MRVPTMTTSSRFFSSSSSSSQVVKRQAAAGGIDYPSAGRAFVGGSALLGMGALVYYGSGQSPYMSTVEESTLWPAYVRERVGQTYKWFGLGLGLTAAQTTFFFRTGVAHRVMGASPMVMMFGGIAAMMGSQMLVRSIPAENTIPKALTFSLFTGCVSLVISPVMLLGGSIVSQAAAYTCVVCSGITALCAVAPSDEFLDMGAPLMGGFGLMVVASLGTMIFPVSVGGAMHTALLYGGTVLFGGLMVWDTQRIVAKAKTSQVYDPCNACIGIYMDAINLFIRIAQMLAMSQGGGRRK
jgi:FtsH-binding integral membrane protein